MLAFYRKHRPKTLADIYGQEHIVEVLQSAARQDRIGHAYLFHGPRGTGKTTTARLLAKLACCFTRAEDEKFRQKGEPCNKCRACEEIDAGRGIDVMEIDAATNTGVDEIRDLKEGIRLSPSSYPKKVVILDEVHMLSKSAFNALLKTLEEPPSHVLLILATTEYDKVPATITSRSQRFHFKKLSNEKIVQKLKMIAKAEKLKVNDEALELIASLAEGSLRDGESLLDQVASSTEEINLENAERVLGKVGFVRVNQLANLVIEKDLKGALNFLNELAEGGHDLVGLTKELIHYLRRVLTLKFNPELKEWYSRDLTSKELESVEKHSKIIEKTFAIKLLQSFIQAYSQMRYSPFASIPLEVALIENLE